MELASNLVWGAVSLLLMGGLLVAIRRGDTRVSGRSSFLLVALVCLLLLPVISLSDDLLEARQATLPASAQTWHLACNDAAAAVEIVPVVFACLLFFALGATNEQTFGRGNQRYRRMSVWLTRSQRLRPPPAFAQ